jgi:hypothetical protein
VLLGCVAVLLLGCVAVLLLDARLLAAASETEMAGTQRPHALVQSEITVLE